MGTIHRAPTFFFLLFGLQSFLYDFSNLFSVNCATSSHFYLKIPCNFFSVINEPSYQICLYFIIKYFTFYFTTISSYLPSFFNQKVSSIEYQVKKEKKRYRKVVFFFLSNYPTKVYTNSIRNQKMFFILIKPSSPPNIHNYYPNQSKSPSH